MVKHLINSSERDNMKKCISCLEEKSLDEYHPHNTTKDKRSTACKICYNRQTLNAKYQKRYGISVEQADSMKTACAICGEKENLHIDHCHTTGKVREALCRACNHGVGNFKDNPQLLIRAAEYLERHND